MMFQTDTVQLSNLWQNKIPSWKTCIGFLKITYDFVTIHNSKSFLWTNFIKIIPIFLGPQSENNFGERGVPVHRVHTFIALLCWGCVELFYSFSFYSPRWSLRFLFCFSKERTNFITVAGNSTLKSLGLQGMEIKEEFGLEYFQILPILINKWIKENLRSV